MDIQLFRSFLMVAKLGNMPQATEQLNITQPTMPMMLGQLWRIGDYVIRNNWQKQMIQCKLRIDV